MSELSNVCQACGGAKLIDLVRMDSQKEKMLAEYDKAYYGGALSELFTVDDYALQHCADCDHIQYEREFSEEVLAKMYEAHAKLREEKRKVAKRDLKSGRADFAVAKLLSSLKNQVGPNASLLDYGAGEGSWSIAAEKLGFKVVAYEPHSIRVSSSVDHASRWCEIECEKFDVIICNQVLEHLNRPSLAVERLKAVSHRDTLIFVSVPNARKLSLQVLARSWPYNGKGNHVVAPFQHLQGFSMKSLLALMARQEFRVDLRAQILLGPVGWRRLVQIIFGKLWVNLGTTALLFKWAT